jgi:hypothetical protein
MEVSGWGELSKKNNKILHLIRKQASKGEHFWILQRVVETIGVRGGFHSSRTEERNGRHRQPRPQAINFASQHVDLTVIKCCAERSGIETLQQFVVAATHVTSTPIVSTKQQHQQHNTHRPKQNYRENT